jgi:hypothetical protein
MKRAVLRTAGAVILLALIAAVVSGCGGGTATTPSGSATKPISQPTEKPELEVVETNIEKDQFGNRYVVGTVKNNTDKEYSYVQVEINLYDDAGTQVGSTMTNANNLEPGGTWKFKAPILEENATKYKVKDVTGF